MQNLLKNVDGQGLLNTSVNQSYLKNVNRKKILGAIKNSGEISRVELASLTRQDAKTVTNIVNSLIEDGLIVTNGHSSYTGGRRRELLTLNGQYGYVIGIQLGINHLRGIVVDFKSNIIVKEEIPILPTESKSSLINRILKILDFLINESNIPKEKIIGIGFVGNGFYDQKKGEWIFSAKQAKWKNVPIVDIFSKKCDCPIYLEDSTRTFAMAEKWYGVGKKRKNFIYINMSAGTGCGIYQKNRIYRGSFNLAGELGHTVVEPNGSLCTCGNRGCLDTIASGWALVKQMKEKLSNGESSLVIDLCKGDLEKIDIDMIFHAASNNDKLAFDILNSAAEYLAVSIANLINVLNPELVVFGGHLASLEDFHILSLEEKIKKYVMPISFNKVKFSTSKLGKYAAVIGITTLFFDEMFQINALN